MALITDYTTIAVIKARLRQLNDHADAADDAVLTALVTNASTIIRTAIRNDLKDQEFDLGSASATRPVYGTFTQWLYLPPHDGVTAVVVDADGTTVNAATYETETTGKRRWSLRFKNADPWATAALVWSGRYRVTALWGYGALPADIAELATDVAIDLWKGRDAGFTGSYGSGDGEVKVLKVLGRQSIISNFVEQYRRAARYE